LGAAAVRTVLAVELQQPLVKTFIRQDKVQEKPVAEMVKGVYQTLQLQEMLPLTLEVVAVALTSQTVDMADLD
jgi:hypothetical protein